MRLGKFGRKEARRQWNNIFTERKTKTCQPRILLQKYLSENVKNEGEGFLGGSVVKNIPVNARDTGLMSGPEGSHMP